MGRYFFILGFILLFFSASSLAADIAPPPGGTIGVEFPPTSAGAPPGPPSGPPPVFSPDPPPSLQNAPNPPAPPIAPSADIPLSGYKVEPLPQAGLLPPDSSLGVQYLPGSRTPGPHLLYGYRDEPMLGASSGYMKVSEIIEHRSSLNTRHVSVHAVVTSTLLGDAACPRRTEPDLAPPCPQQRITIADSADPTRNMDYDVQVLLKPGEEIDYKPGQEVDIDGSVLSDEGYVIIKSEAKSD